MQIIADCNVRQLAGKLDAFAPRLLSLTCRRFAVASRRSINSGRLQRGDDQTGEWARLCERFEQLGVEAAAADQLDSFNDVVRSGLTS